MADVEGKEIIRQSLDELAPIYAQTKTIAVVGLSSNREKPSHGIARYLKIYGYRIIPVNPMTDEILGEKSYPDLASIPDEIDIDVDDKVALARAPVDADFLSVARLAETHETIGLFGVVAVVAIGIEGVVDLVTHHPAHFRFRQLPVERVRDDDMDVVDAVMGT